MEIPLDEVVYFDVVTANHSTGAAQDADSTPTFEVFEEATDTDIGVGGNLTKRTNKTGNYRGSFTASSANGFELGKWYSVVVSATVGSVAGKMIARSFRLVAAEISAGLREVRATTTEPATTWYVSKSGNDSNDGHSWAAAKLTVTAAVAAAASGDTIMVGPGTYTEAGNLSLIAKILVLRGSGLSTKITQSADDYTISLGQKCVVEDLWCENTKNSASAVGLYAVGSTYITVRRVLASSSYGTGAVLGNTSGCTDLVVEDSKFTGKVGAMRSSLGSRRRFSRVSGYVETEGSATVIDIGGGDARVEDLIATGLLTTDYGETIVAVKTSSVCNLVRVLATATAAGDENVAMGLWVDSGTTRLQDSVIAASCMGPNEWDLQIDANSTLNVVHSGYRSSKVTGAGTLTNLAQSAADAALVANNLDHLLKTAITSGDVTNNSALAKLVSKLATAAWSSYDNTTDSLEARSDTAVTVGANNDKTGYALTSAYDAAKTAAQAGSAMTLTSGERNAVADALLSRSVATVEGTAPEHSLCTIVLATLEGSIGGSTWTIKRTDGSTTHVTKTVATNANALPIVGVS